MQPSIDSIRELAYWIYLERNGADGSAEQDWLNAEQRLKSAADASADRPTAAIDESLRESFPASDPPASHLPDEPPVNADAQWKAAESRRKPKRSAAPDGAAAKGAKTKSSKGNGSTGKRGGSKGTSPEQP
jgi:type IV secretory pathway VirB10-like protein